MNLKHSAFFALGLTFIAPGIAQAGPTIEFSHIDRRMVQPTTPCGRGLEHQEIKAFQLLQAGDNLRMRGFRVLDDKKCLEVYQAEFASYKALNSFVRQQPLADYSFTSISYSIYEATIQKAIKSGNSALYKTFLTTDISSSASEEFHELVGTLRNNPGAFLKTYCTMLDGHQQNAVVRQQYDFNKPLSAHLFSTDGGAGNACMNQWNASMKEGFDLFQQPSNQQ